MDDMEFVELEPGIVVQIDPEHDQRFGGCFMMVTEVRSWGAIGYVPIAGTDGTAYYRCPKEAMEVVGKAEWLLQRDFGEDSDYRTKGE